MPRFEFSLNGPNEPVRLAGAVTCPTFEQAMSAIAEQIDVEQGDTLEIGVSGFPPARFDAVFEGVDEVLAWRQRNRKAA